MSKPNKRIFKLARLARLEGLEEAAKIYCVNCANGIALSDGKNGMHVGGLYCYSHAIRARIADVSYKSETPVAKQLYWRCELCGEYREVGTDCYCEDR